MRPDLQRACDGNGLRRTGVQTHNSNAMNTTCAIVNGVCSVHGFRGTEDRLCKVCHRLGWNRVKHERPQPRPPMPDEPRLLDELASVIMAAAKWSIHGWPVVSTEELTRRKSICSVCPEWDATARAGLGKCKRCGCTKLKWWLATEKCRAGKWNVLTGEHL